MLSPFLVIVEFAVSTDYPLFIDSELQDPEVNKENLGHDEDNPVRQVSAV